MTEYIPFENIEWINMKLDNNTGEETETDKDYFLTSKDFYELDAGCQRIQAEFLFFGHTNTSDKVTNFTGNFTAFGYDENYNFIQYFNIAHTGDSDYYRHADQDIINWLKAGVRYIRFRLFNSSSTRLRPGNTDTGSYRYPYSFSCGTECWYWTVDREQRTIYTDELKVANAESLTYPLPIALWQVGTDDIEHGLLLPQKMIGAFAYTENLRKVSIPESVKKIGRYAFYGSNITSVKIARDCVYYSTSFPTDCTIEYYD